MSKNIYTPSLDNVYGLYDHAQAKPFNGAAVDFDGVFALYGKEPEGHTQTMMDETLRQTVGNSVPLAVITGKDERDIADQITTPFRARAIELGIDLDTPNFRVYANNGARVIEVGAMNDVLIEKKDFDPETLRQVQQLEIVQLFMEIYGIFNEIRGRIPGSFKNSRYRDGEPAPGFSIDPEDLKTEPVQHLYERLSRLAGTNKNLDRFAIGEMFKRQLAAAQLDVPVAVTDGAVDLAPAKRSALEDVARWTRAQVEDLFRIGDNPTGSDYTLLAGKRHEWRGGFTNVTVNRKQLGNLREQANFADYDLTPVEIPGEENQFQKALKAMKRAQFKPAIEAYEYADAAE